MIEKKIWSQVSLQITLQNAITSYFIDKNKDKNKNICSQDKCCHIFAFILET